MILGVTSMKGKGKVTLMKTCTIGNERPFPWTTKRPDPRTRWEGLRPYIPRPIAPAVPPLLPLVPPTLGMRLKRPRLPGVLRALVQSRPLHGPHVITSFQDTLGSSVGMLLWLYIKAFMCSDCINVKTRRWLRKVISWRFAGVKVSVIPCIYTFSRILTCISA